MFLVNPFLPNLKSFDQLSTVKVVFHFSVLHHLPFDVIGKLTIEVILSSSAGICSSAELFIMPYDLMAHQ